MGIGYRCQLKPKTPSAGARFSYIKRQGKYEREDDDLVYSADRNMPLFAAENAADFWFAADEFERSNARVCVEFELNLPPELDLQQQVLCVESFIDSLNKKAGRFPTSYAIHHDKNGANPHVHLMLSERALDGIERPGELFFKRANTAKPELGGNKKSLFFNKSSENILWTRASWAESCNNTLIANGFDARFDSRTKFAQREEAIQRNDLVRAVQLSTLTEKHEGPVRGSIRKRLASGALERDSVDFEVLQLLDSNDTIKDFNRELELFAVTASDDQLRAFLACESAHDKLSFFIDMHEPEALEHERNHHNEADQRPSFSAGSTVTAGLQEHIEHLSHVQSLANNQILQHEISRSKSSEPAERDRDVHNVRGFVQAAIQSSDTAARDELRHVPEPERVLSQTELNELYRQAERAASDAELQADFANCKLDDLRADARRLSADIQSAKPTVLQRVLIKIGLSVDQSIELKRHVRPLLDSIRQSEIEVKQLNERARDLRIDAEHLKIRADFSENLKPSASESVSLEFYNFQKRFEAGQTAEQLERKRELELLKKSAPASTQLDRKPRGPKL